MNCLPNCPFDHNRTREHLLHHIKNQIPTIIKHTDISLLPQREDFLETQISRLFAKQVADNKPILFLPTSVNEAHEYINKNLTYCIQLFGVLPCGSKACVILENVPVHVDIMVPQSMSTDVFKSFITEQMMSQQMSRSGIEVVQMYHHHGFQKKKRDYIRLLFSTLMDRRKLIDYIHSRNKERKLAGLTLYETASDDFSGADTTYYFPKVAREYRFATADWNRIETYRVTDSTKCKYNFVVDVSNIKKLSSAQRKQLTAPGNFLGPYIMRDNTMVADWDIETHRTIENGQVPTINDYDFTIFMMCVAFFWHGSTKPLMTVNVVEGHSGYRKTKDAFPIDVTICCDEETDLLCAYMDVIKCMQPEILTAFNGGNFDWPLYREKCKRAKLLARLKDCFCVLPPKTAGKWGDTEENIARFSFKKEKIKIDAETSHELQCVANFPGMIDTDALPVFLKLYPRAEVRKSASLNFFLAKNDLSSKEDMHFKRMFRVIERSRMLRHANPMCHCGTPCDCCRSMVREIDYPPLDTDEPEYSTTPYDFTAKCCACGKRQKNVEDMTAVGYYCVIDCIRPQQLFVKRGIIPDKRELSTLSYVTLYDSFYRADGMKVCNLIGAYSHKAEIAFSNARSLKTDEEKDHYPGAHVFFPNRGFNNKLPLTGLDFGSLYPNLMRTYNFSPDMIVYTREEAEELEAEGYTLHHIKPFAYERGVERGHPDNKKLIGEGWTVRHNGILTSEDTHIIESYDKINGKYVPKRGRKALPGERIGIFAFIVGKLFNKRVPIKAEFVRLVKLEEYMEKNHLEEFEGMTLADCIFQKNKTESKQKAIKILANTFYGKSGDFRAAIYELLVAAGITCAGQYCIKLVADYVRSKGFTVQYGDTDSLYLTAPPESYIEFTIPYQEGLKKLHPDDKAGRIALREIYWTQMVTKTMKIMNELKADVSDFLLANNSTIFLNMAYEEVGMPWDLTGKKKYYMTAHVEEINFNPKEIFIRGIDIVKQGQAKIAKMLGEEFMREILSLENEREAIEIAVDKIRKYYTSGTDPTLFALSGRYRPDKKNVPIQTFTARMVKVAESHKNDPILSALYEPPEAGDKFTYIICKKDQLYSMSGTKIEKKKGHQMEFLRVYLASQNTDDPMCIDLDYYMKRQVVGLFARFIAYHPDFQPPIGMFDVETKEGYRQMDIYCVDKAAEYLCKICDEITGFDKKDQQQVGKDYRAIFRDATKRINKYMWGIVGPSTYILQNMTQCENSALFVDQFRTLATANVKPSNYGKRLTTRMLQYTSLAKIQANFTATHKYRMQYLHLMEKKIINALFEHAFTARDVLYTYNESFLELMNELRTLRGNTVVIDDSRYILVVPDTDAREELKVVYTLFLKLITCYTLRATSELTLAYLNKLQTSYDLPEESLEREVQKTTQYDYEWS